MKMISFLSLPGILLVLLLFLLSFPIPGTSQANQEYVYHSCNNATSYTPNSIFASNLKSLLSSLSSNSFRTLYYNSTFGRSTDTVYGSFLCRGDVTADVCQYCIQDEAKEILNRCPNQKTAIIWYDECMLRYSNRPFFSTMEASPQLLLTNIANASDPDRFSQLVTDALGRIAARAASGNTSLPMFATEEVNLTRSQTVYTLVQCTPDISLSDCNRCLLGGIPEVLVCCSRRAGARFLRPSCSGRFELYPFYRITAPRPPPPTADTGYVTHDCNNATLYTPNSTFASNLKSLLSSLSSNYMLDTGFYNSTFGHSTDTVYGSFLCRGDITANVCQDCVRTATRDILNRCPNEEMAIIWYVKCMLRYSSRPFFSTMQTSPQLMLYNTANVSEPDRFNQMVKVTAVMDRITTRAASGTTSGRMFATEEVNLTTSLTLYTLVQCTPDISLSDCDKCLREGIPNVIVCCVSKLGAQFLRPSCNARFEVFPFYEIPATPGGNGSKSKIVIIITLSTLAAILLLGSSVYGLQRWITWQKRKKDNSEEVQLYEFGTRTNTELPHGNFRSEESRESQDFPSIPLSILWLATENFSNENKLGEGGFGPVYKGMLPDGKEIAVKRLSRSSAQGIEEFKNEVILIIKLQHKNLVRLLGCCLEGNEMMLVYEYMPNSSLDVFLFEDEARRAQLDWKRRRSIIGGIARGLMYLHEDSRLRIIHRDLKPSNVLLDNAMNPKISDFGIARIFAETQSQANTKRVVGTYGYMAPEYAMEGLFSMKSDVFSFGVILLEIISGRKNSGFHLSEHGRSLLLHAWSLWCEGKGLELMDPLIEKSCETSEVLKCIHIGLLCVQEDAEDRPTMSTIVVMLATDTITLPRPTQPAFSVGRVGERMRQSSKSPMNCSINEVTLSNVEPR